MRWSIEKCASPERISQIKFLRDIKKKDNISFHLSRDKYREQMNWLDYLTWEENLINVDVKDIFGSGMCMGFALTQIREWASPCNTSKYSFEEQTLRRHYRHKKKLHSYKYMGTYSPETSMVAKVISNLGFKADSLYVKEMQSPFNSLNQLNQMYTEILSYLNNGGETYYCFYFRKKIYYGLEQLKISHIFPIKVESKNCFVMADLAKLNYMYRFKENITGKYTSFTKAFASKFGFEYLKMHMISKKFPENQMNVNDFKFEILKVEPIPPLC